MLKKNQTKESFGWNDEEEEKEGKTERKRMKNKKIETDEGLGQRKRRRKKKEADMFRVKETTVIWNKKVMQKWKKWTKSLATRERIITSK